MNHILDKIRKLLALASSPNEHEAALALAKAMELMQAHSIEMAEVESSDPSNDWVQEPTEFSWKWGRPRHPVTRAMLQVLREYFLVECFWTTTKEGSDYVRRVQLFGRRDRVAIAQHVLAFMSTQADRLFEIYWGTHGLRKVVDPVTGRVYRESSKVVDRNSYYAGFAIGIARQLRSQKPPNGSPGFAIVSAAEHELRHEVSIRFPNLKEVSDKTQRDHFATERGFQDGKNSTIHSAIPSKQEAPLQITDGRSS